MTFFALPSFLPGALVARLALASLGLSLGFSLASCGSPEPGSGEEEDDDGAAGGGDGADASIKPRDAGTPIKSVKDASATPSKPSPARDAGDTLRDAGNGDGLIDAGNPLGDVVGSVDWDAIFSADGGLFTPPPPPGPASPDNPKECPETAPENPIGSCIGVPVYATCNYGSYSCLCDWIHWLCI